MKMKNVSIEISFTGNNFSAYVPNLPGCVSVGDSPYEVKTNIEEAIKFHIKGSLEDDDPIPKVFTQPYKLSFKFDTQSLLKYYEGIISKSALERLTGINQRQLSHYANGIKKPRKKQIDKIEKALHQLGHELAAVEL